MSCEICDRRPIIEDQPTHICVGCQGVMGPKCILCCDRKTQEEWTQLVGLAMNFEKKGKLVFLLWIQLTVIMAMVQMPFIALARKLRA